MSILVSPPLRTAKARAAMRAQCQGHRCCAVGKAGVCGAPAVRSVMQLFGQGTWPGVVELFFCAKHRPRYRKESRVS
jgi:hypothetical protein